MFLMYLVLFYALCLLAAFIFLSSIMLSYRKMHRKVLLYIKLYSNVYINKSVFLLLFVGKPMLLGRLIVDDVAQMNRGRIKDLLVQDLKWTTLLLWFIWYESALAADLDCNIPTSLSVALSHVIDALFMSLCYARNVSILSTGNHLITFISKGSINACMCTTSL